jgi:hypothetical protein
MTSFTAFIIVLLIFIIVSMLPIEEEEKKREEANKALLRERDRQEQLDREWNEVWKSSDVLPSPESF